MVKDLRFSSYMLSISAYLDYPVKTFWNGMMRNGPSYKRTAVKQGLARTLRGHLSVVCN